MKIKEHVRKYAAEQGNAEEEVLNKGMEEKSRAFKKKGAEVYEKVYDFKQDSRYAKQQLKQSFSNRSLHCSGA